MTPRVTSDSSALIDLVVSELLPAVEALGVKVVDHGSSRSFDDAQVTLEAGDVRFRVIRERSKHFVDFGSVTKPHVWFDSAVVAYYLGLGGNAGFHSSDPRSVLKGLAEFLKTFSGELALRFSSSRFEQTARELTSVRQARDKARWG